MYFAIILSYFTSEINQSFIYTHNAQELKTSLNVHRARVKLSTSYT